LDEEAFPEAGWNDFPIVLLTWWLEGALKLRERLDVDNGHYVPPRAFAKHMEQARAGLSLAYGLKASNTAGLLRVVGYSSLVACLVASEEEVTIQ
jgi:hypothetical protein